MCEEWDPPGTNSATQAETSKPSSNSYPSNSWNNDSNWRKNPTDHREQFGSRQFSNNKYSNNRPNRNNPRGYDSNQQRGFDRDQNQHRGYDREPRSYDRDQNQRGGGYDRDQNQRSYGRGQNQSGSDENTLMDTIKVSSRYVGRIIGRGGSKISDLQFESSARINVLKETEGDQTFIKISGTQESIDKAKELINELTVDRNQYSNRSNE